MSGRSPERPPECSQLDFWVGEWDCSWDGGRGRNIVTAECEGRLILERFAMDGFTGMSVSSFDERLGRWRQTWADSAGNQWRFVGGMEGDRMVLGTADEEAGRPVLRRMVFAEIEADGLDWTWERSDDGGGTWTVLWAIRYRRRLVRPLRGRGGANAAGALVRSSPIPRSGR